jgi:lipopolysaccharide heptosyltransferase II
MKILIIRFSSFGDVLQTLSVAGRLGESFPHSEIHWVTRSEFEPLLRGHPRIAKVWSVTKGAGFSDLRSLARQMRKEKFTHIYDAHNNLRSHLLGLLLAGFMGWRRWTGQQKFLRRSIYRFRRFMLFNFRKNFFPKPFSGQFALLEPLKKWGVSVVAPTAPQLFLDPTQKEKVYAELPQVDFVTLAPSAAFPLKRWPMEHWKSLVAACPDTRFVVLGGPEDNFLQELAETFPLRVINLAGKLSLTESAHVVARSLALVSNDTGLMHVAEQIGKPCLALMGPAPFGFPSRGSTKVFELDLPCRPCSKHGQGPCVNSEFQKCLRDISPAAVAGALKGVIDAKVDASLPR